MNGAVKRSVKYRAARHRRVRDPQGYADCRCSAARIDRNKEITTRTRRLREIVGCALTVQAQVRDNHYVSKLHHYSLAAE